MPFLIAVNTAAPTPDAPFPIVVVEVPEPTLAALVLFQTDNIFPEDVGLRTQLESLAFEKRFLTHAPSARKKIVALWALRHGTRTDQIPILCINDSA